MYRWLFFRVIICLCASIGLLKTEGVGAQTESRENKQEQEVMAANWLAEGNQTGTFLGSSVASAGDVNNDGYADVIVGAQKYDNGELDEGRVFAFYGSAFGLSATPNWIAESNQIDSRFGFAIARAGDVNGDGFDDVLVGAQTYDNGELDEGAAFVWLGSADGLNGGVSGTPANAAWSGEGGQGGAYYGKSLSGAGDVNGDGFDDIMVGASRADFTAGRADSGQIQTEEGRVYVYYGSEFGLSLVPNWQVESTQPDSRLGRATGSAGDVNGDGFDDILVGAWEYDNGEINEGIALLWYGSAGGVNNGVAGTVENAGWMAESNQASANLGISVATAGDVNGDGYNDVLVGAISYNNGQAYEGAAFLWMGSEDGVNQGVSGNPSNAVWMAESNQADSKFGLSVATAGDLNRDGYDDIVVGGWAYDNNQTDEGGALVWLGSAMGVNYGFNGLPNNATGRLFGSQAGSSFGWAVAGAGDVNGDGFDDILVGAFGYDNDLVDEGRAYLYQGTSDSLMLSAVWGATSSQANSHFGWVVDGAGDVNGDGYEDILIGAPQFDNGEVDEGQVYFYLGAANSFPDTISWVVESNQASAFLGDSVAGIGDVNGDGYDDIALGIPRYDSGLVNVGQVWVFYGSETGLATIADWVITGEQAGESLGEVVAGAGDVNGDGFDDLVVGAARWDNGETDEGRVLVYHGSESGLEIVPAWSVEGDQPSSGLGEVAAGAGDINGDGFDDLIVSAPRWDNGQLDEGRVWVYNGTETGLEMASSWFIEADQVSAYGGSAVDGAGDVNRDGYSDILIGASGFDNGHVDEGRTYLFLGSSSGVALFPVWAIEGNQTGAGLGSALSGAGDLNRDGFGDVLVAAARYDNGHIDEGRVFAFHGSPSGLQPVASWIAESNRTNAYLGVSVAGIGDFNGDLYYDAIMSGNGSNAQGVLGGMVRVYRGSGVFD